MAINEMDARLISQAEQVTTLTDSALISVAEGEGQPQKNISFADMVDAINGKDSEIATANTVEYVRGLDANGNPIMINKADLASVVANLLSEKGRYPFMHRGAASDCLAASSGWWTTNDSTTNMPVDSYKFGVLVVFQYSNFSIRIWANNNGDKKIRSESLGLTKGWMDF